MLIATFGPSTGWAGKTIDYENGVFTLQGYGPISAADVLNYDRQSPLLWGYEGLKDWVASQVQAGPAVPPVGHPTMGGAIAGGAVAAPAQKKGGIPAWAIVLIVLGVVVALIAAIYLPAKAGQDAKARESSVKEGIHSIQIGVQSYAVDNTDAYPEPSTVNETGMVTYVDYWPTNPYTGGPMAQGTGPGDYSYELSADGTSFTLTGYGKDGPVITVP